MARVIIVLTFAAPLLSGCTQLDDARLEGRLRRMARSAYVASPSACNGVPHSVDYAKGFEEGYYDVASGGDGCPPPLPPKKYWSATYASPVGREHIEAWFQGFRDGAAAAKAEGVAGYGLLHVSAEHRVAEPHKFIAPPTPQPPKPTPPLPEPHPIPIDEPKSAGQDETNSLTPVLGLPPTLIDPPAPPARSKSPPPRPTPPPLDPAIERGSADSNGWRAAAPAPTFELTRGEFKEPPTETRSQITPVSATSDEEGWRPAINSIRFNLSGAVPLDR